MAYLQLIKLKYPYVLKMRNGVMLELSDWQDLTTAWVVFYGNEYALRAEDSVVVDCGANIGAFSLLCAACLPNAKIIAIEAFPSTYARLVGGIAENGAEAQVDAINGAIVGIAGSVFMDDAPDVASHSRKIGGTTGVAVEGYTLNRILDERNLNEVDLLKVDIEGAEYSLFKETPKSVLRRFKRIGLEYHGNGDTKELFNCIESAGFFVGRYPKKGNSGVVEFIRKGRLQL
ncbi:MAG: FkbM family methyltransferase [Coraliomargaritaceae bacterium]